MTILCGLQYWRGATKKRASKVSLLFFGKSKHRPKDDILHFSTIFWCQKLEVSFFGSAAPVCPFYAGHMPSICQAYARHKPGICQAYAKNMPSICRAYAR